MSTYKYINSKTLGEGSEVRFNTNKIAQLGKRLVKVGGQKVGMCNNVAPVSCMDGYGNIEKLSAAYPGMNGFFDNNEVCYLDTWECTNEDKEGNKLCNQPDIYRFHDRMLVTYMSGDDRIIEMYDKGGKRLINKQILPNVSEIYGIENLGGDRYNFSYTHDGQYYTQNVKYEIPQFGDGEYFFNEFEFGKIPTGVEVISMGGFNLDLEEPVNWGTGVENMKTISSNEGTTEEGEEGNILSNLISQEEEVSWSGTWGDGEEGLFGGDNVNVPENSWANELDEGDTITTYTKDGVGYVVTGKKTEDGTVEYGEPEAITPDDYECIMPQVIDVETNTSMVVYEKGGVTYVGAFQNDGGEIVEIGSQEIGAISGSFYSVDKVEDEIMALAYKASAHMLTYKMVGGSYDLENELDHYQSDEEGVKNLFMHKVGTNYYAMIMGIIKEIDGVETRYTKVEIAKVAKGTGKISIVKEYNDIPCDLKNVRKSGSKFSFICESGVKDISIVPPPEDKVIGKIKSLGGKVCGDGVVQPDNGEQCDDGDSNDNNECNNLCKYNDLCGEDGCGKVGGTCAEQPVIDNAVFAEGSPENDNTAWSYGYSLEGGACKWSCEVGYMKGGGNECIAIEGNERLGITEDWSDAQNWSYGTVPGEGDFVIIDGGSKHPTLDILTGTVKIKSLLIGMSKGKQLTLINGGISTNMLVVEENLLVGPGGIITHYGNIDKVESRLGINVKGNLTIREGGRIDVSGRGFGGDANNNDYGFGTGGGQSFYGSKRAPGGGGSYGGKCSTSQTRSANSTCKGTYGSETQPEDLGSGGGYGQVGRGGNGGGAIKLVVGGKLTVDGEIRSNGDNGISSGRRAGGGGGAGGSIWLEVGEISGGGKISADGGIGGIRSYRGGAGGGGRIAMYYGVNNFKGYIKANGGTAYGNAGGGSVYMKQLGNNGIGEIKMVGNTNYKFIGTYFSKIDIQKNTSIYSNDTNISFMGSAEVNELVLDGSTLVNRGRILLKGKYELRDNGRYIQRQGGWIGGSGVMEVTAGGNNKWDIEKEGYEYPRFSKITVNNGVELKHTLGEGYAMIIESEGNFDVIGELDVSGGGGGEINMKVGGILNLEGGILSDGTTNNGGKIEGVIGTLVGGGRIEADGKQTGGNIIMEYDTSNFTGTINANGGGGVKLTQKGTDGTSDVRFIGDSNYILNGTYFSKVTVIKDTGIYGGDTSISISGNPRIEILLLDGSTITNKGDITINSEFELKDNGRYIQPTTTGWIGGGGDLNIKNGGDNKWDIVKSGYRIPKFANVNIDEGKVLTQTFNNSSHTYSLILESTEDINVLGRIDVSGRGYGGDTNNNDYGYGPGGGESFYGSKRAPGGGGSYGGKCSTSQTRSANSTCKGTYGSETQPVDLGSGGGYGQVGKGGNGGGSIKLVVRGELTVDGEIRSNGDNGISSGRRAGGGGGAGGSIWLEVGEISGGGKISADGGIGGIRSYRGGAGGGGRIAMYYGVNNFTGYIKSNGGTAYGEADGGTVYMKQTGDNGVGEIQIVGNSNYIFDESYFVNVDVHNNNSLFGNRSNVVFRGVGTIKNLYSDGTDIINIGTITINELYEISGSARYVQPDGTGIISGNGDLLVKNGGGNTWDIVSTGYKRPYFQNITINGGAKLTHSVGVGYSTIFKSTTNTTINGDIDISNTNGGDVDLIIGGVLTVDGKIRTDGTSNGGNIKLDIGTFEGTGKIEADGNTNGGDINIVYNSSNFMGSVNANVNGNVYMEQRISNGTSEIKLVGNSIYEFKGTYFSGVTVIKDTGIYGGDTSVIFEGDATINYLLLDGSEITNNGEIIINSEFELKDNGRYIQPTTTGWIGGGGDLNISNGGDNRWDIVKSGYRIPKFANVTINEGEVLSQTFNDGSHKYSLILESTEDINVLGRIDVSGRGYGGDTNNNDYGYGLGGGESFYGSNRAPGGGGSYGGKCSTSQTRSANSTCKGTYGSETQPEDLGSGGGYGTYGKGGNGGGAVKLVVGGKLTVDGEIRCNGENGIRSSSRAGGGGGAGGSIWLEVGEISGGGKISADGGNGAGRSYYGGAGGGGRIALYYFSNTYTGELTANGGTSYGYAENGTVYSILKS